MKERKREDETDLVRRLVDPAERSNQIDSARIFVYNDNGQITTSLLPREVRSREDDREIGGR